MQLVEKKTGVQQRREELRDQYWAGEPAWLGTKEKGFLRAPRTLPLILSVLASKEVSGNKDPSRVYVELLARHMGEGVISMISEEDHAFASGYYGTRATRTWRERMRILQENGFIKVERRGNLTYGTVLLVHPSIAIKALYAAKKVDEHWWDTYRQRQRDMKETSYEALEEGRKKSKKKSA